MHFNLLFALRLDPATRDAPGRKHKGVRTILAYDRNFQVFGERR
jgi:hypothetical protein